MFIPTDSYEKLQINTKPFDSNLKKEQSTSNQPDNLLNQFTKSLVSTLVKGKLLLTRQFYFHTE